MDRLKEIEAELEIIRARLEELAEMGEPEEQDEVLRAQILQERDIEVDDLTARWDELMQEREPLLQRARKLDEIREAARNLARTEPGDGRYLGGSGPYFAPNKDPFDADPLTLPRQEVISRAMTVLERERAVEVPDDAKAQVESFMRRSGSPDEGHYQLDGGYIARRLLLTENDAYRSAFQKYVRFGAQAAYTPEEQAAVARYQNYEIQRAMGEVNGNTGGFGIPVLIDPSIILTSGAADVPLLRYCRIETVTNNIWKGVSSAGMTWAFSTEGTESTDNSPTLAQPTVEVHTARGVVPYSIEVSMDYPGFAAEIGQLINQGYNDLLAVATMTGSGNTAPYGIFTALDAVTTSEVAVTTAGSFSGEDVFKIWNALPERFRGNATWVMSVHVQSAIRQFAAQASATSAYFTVDLTGGQFRINERPVIITDYAPTFPLGVPGTTGAANILAVGDWRQAYLWVRRAGMTIEQIPHIFGASGLPKAQRALFAWARVGGNVISPNAARLLTNTT